MANSDSEELTKFKECLSENLEELSQVYLAHKQKLEACEEDIAQWKRFIKDYNVLQEKLKTYPDKTSYEIMVPIGSLAYMKGKAIHTNEILVHLGESWFAERSCKNALEIIERRKKVCEDNLKNAEKISKMHKGWLSQTEEMAAEDGELANIVEHVTEEEFQDMNKKHKERIAKQMVASGATEAENNTSSSTLEEESEMIEKFLHLDALEEQERLKGELEDGDSDEDSSSSSEVNPKPSCTQLNAACMRGKDKLTRRVSWADQISDTTQDDIDLPTPTPIKLKYRSRQKSLPSDLGPSDADLDLPLAIGNQATNCTTTDIEGDAFKSPESPSDLYKLINALTVSTDEPQPKSILKKKSESEDSEKNSVGFREDTIPLKYIPKSPDELLFPENFPLSESPREIKKLKPAFNYKVVARRDGEYPADYPSESPEEPKKVSRFKASRMNK